VTWSGIVNSVVDTADSSATVRWVAVVTTDNY